MIGETNEETVANLRDYLATVRTPYDELVLIAHGSMFCRLPDDLEKRGEFLQEMLKSPPIPPLSDNRSWWEKHNRRNRGSKD